MTPKNDIKAVIYTLGEQESLGLQEITQWRDQNEPNFISLDTQSPSLQGDVTHLDLQDLYSVQLKEVQALQEMGNVNWVGKLHEYLAIRVNDIGRQEPEFILNSYYKTKTPRFSFYVKIPDCKQPLGATQTSTTFSAKKPAKQYAAKKVIDWLISNKYMPADGSVRFPKISTPAVTTRINNETSKSQVPILCARLGFKCPRYIIDPVAPCSPLYNGYADFGCDPRIPDQIGHVYNIFGKKNTKTEIAKLVLDFLNARMAKVQSSY